MARRKSKSVMRDKAFQRWMRDPQDPITRAVYFSVELITSLDRRTRLGRNAGWVYAARNPHFGPDVLKIGQTRLSPLDRVEQLSNSTAIYEPFELVYFVHTAEREDAEAMVHAMLNTCRINPRREFFKVDALQAAEAMVRVAEIMGAGMKRGWPVLALPHRSVECPACSRSRTQFPGVLVPLQVECGACSHVFHVTTTTPPGNA